ncbi:MAG: hypothetical protein A2885_09420 [Sphingopyxis sp. RIFCSPHIGHO2_01_FULL_65_24]|nr:MAG: hypothetical protein A2885_09420 [Sphingopyxis sp. RIFCSPHIGHO2_01_FULL_65_24]
MISKRANAILTLTALMMALGLVSCNHDRLAKAISAERQSQATTSDENGHAVDTASASLVLTPEPANPQFD